VGSLTVQNGTQSKVLEVTAKLCPVQIWRIRKLSSKFTMIFYYVNTNKMHTLHSLFYLTTALHVSGVTITHLQQHK